MVSWRDREKRVIRSTISAPRSKRSGDKPGVVIRVSLAKSMPTSKEDATRLRSASFGWVTSSHASLQLRPL